mmetsp:Transcript_51472/g.155945  ORF Transcript_51472/g.155945 Transcript_51472/m.155945 type:complete len:328 (+) Transcript_51472:55-1038(+)
MVALTGAALCLFFPLAVAAGGTAPADAVALFQGRPALAARTNTSVNVEALRSVLLAVKADIEKRAADAQSKPGAPAAGAPLSTVRPILKRATKFLDGEFTKMNATRKAETCGTACVVGIVLDSIAIINGAGMVQKGEKDMKCSTPVLLEWWLVGLLTLMQDQKLAFPEAVHMLSQQLTSIGYGSSTPTAEGLKIFHGLHGVLSQMGVARVTGAAMNKALDQLGKGPKGVFQGLTLALAAGTLWFTADLHEGDSDTYPTWNSALSDGFYQALITMTTIGYGDYSLTTDWGKILTPWALPWMTTAWGRFASALASGPADPTEDSSEDVC